jgi:predicted transcriptional regulator
MKKVIENEKKVTEAAINKIVAKEGSKSSKMIELFEMGVPVKEIATIMDVRYNFVYNVVSNYANVNGIETATNKTSGKKELIIELFKQGSTNKEIAAEVKSPYNYVFNVIKKYKATLETNEETVSE